MLVSTHIHHFRSCTDVSVSDIGSMLVLLGKNGVGKTNVLLAIEWAAQVGSSRGGDIPSHHADTRGDVTLTLMLKGKIYNYRLTIETTHETNAEGLALPSRRVIESLTVALENSRWDAVFSRDGKSAKYGVDEKPIEISETTPAASALASLFPNDPSTQVIVRVMQFLSGVRYLPLDTPAKETYEYSIVREAEYASESITIGNRRNSDARQLQIQILDLYKKRPDAFEELLNLVGENGLGIIADLKIEEFSFPTQESAPNSKTEKYFFFRWHPTLNRDRNRAFKDLSYGTRRLLRLFITMLHEEPTILLIEQPEDGIHKSLLHKLIPTLSAYCEYCQIFVASHAADILNRAQPEQIRLVGMNEGLTDVRMLTDVELDAAHNFIRDDGGLADFLDLVQD